MDKTETRSNPGILNFLHIFLAVTRTHKYTDGPQKMRFLDSGDFKMCKYFHVYRYKNFHIYLLLVLIYIVQLCDS